MRVGLTRIHVSEPNVCLVAIAGEVLARPRALYEGVRGERAQELGFGVTTSAKCRGTELVTRQSAVVVLERGRAAVAQPPRWSVTTRGAG